MTFSVENFTRVYDDSTGYYVEVRPDADAGDLVQIDASEQGQSAPLMMPPEQARLLAKALVRVADGLEAESCAPCGRGMLQTAEVADEIRSRGGVLIEFLHGGKNNSDRVGCKWTDKDGRVHIGDFVHRLFTPKEVVDRMWPESRESL